MDRQELIKLVKIYKNDQPIIYFTKSELINLVNWKSTKLLKLFQDNSEEEVKEITTLSFANKNDKLKLHILTALSGINYIYASSILMFMDKNKYPNLDISVWKQLHKKGLIGYNLWGQKFSLNDWIIYISAITKLAQESNLSAKEVKTMLLNENIEESTKR